MFDTKIKHGQIVSNSNRLAFWLDGKKLHDGTGYSLWSIKTQTYPKVGIYRGEFDGLYTKHTDDPAYMFDSYVYRVQISDSGFDEIKNANEVGARPVVSEADKLVVQEEL
jgi:hypothetical protein